MRLCCVSPLPKPDIPLRKGEKGMKLLNRLLTLGLCVAVTVTVLSLFTPAFARYSNVASTAAVYGYTGLSPVEQTMSPDTAVYDFGIYSSDADRTAFTHTVRICEDGPVEGVLRFYWDETTRTNKDILVYIENGYYTSMSSSGYTDYTVSAADGNLQVPFSLLFPSASLATDRVAELEVSWYPADGDEPTLFARYLLTVPADSEGTAPVFVAEDSAFLTDRLLRVAVTTPADHTGVLLAPADGTFAVGTRCFWDAYPHGVTLLRESAVFIPREGDSIRLLMDLSAHLSDDSPVSLTVGVSDTVSDTLTCAPLTSVKPLTVAMSDAVGLVTASEPLTVTLTEAASFRDSDWSRTGDTPGDLTWQVQRYAEGALHPVAVEEDLSVTATQTESGGTFTVSSLDGAALPGTYLLTVTQYYYDYPVLETPIWIFIDYR